MSEHDDDGDEGAMRAPVHGLAASTLPDIGQALVQHPAKLVREWVRAVLLPPAIRRLYDTGMGIERFDTPTAVGSVLRIEAPAAVQVKALAALVSIGVPTQLGIVDSDSNVLPGVLALGPLELDAARAEAHGERYVDAATHARLVAAHQADGPLAEQPVAPVASTLRPMAERIAAGEFEVVEVDEGVGVVVPEGKYPPEAAPVDPATLPPTTEQQMLANRRAKRAGQPLPYPEVAR